jgi:hypothetical protein
LFDGPLDMDALLPAALIGKYAGVSTAAVCNWVRRGLLPVATDADGSEIRDDRGRARYRLRDAARADLVAQDRAKTLARTTARRNPGELAA